jgi:molybdate transport system substrate-binding protein
MQEIIPLFEKGHRPQAEATYTSRQLYGQIVNARALRHAAGRRRENPAKLQARVRAEAPSFTPRAAWCCGPSRRNCGACPGPGREGLRQGPPSHVETAPYGTSSMKAMQAGVSGTRCSPPGLRPEHQPPFQFASTGAADVGFCALVVHLHPRGREGLLPRGARRRPRSSRPPASSRAPEPRGRPQVRQVPEHAEVAAIKRIRLRIDAEPLVLRPSRPLITRCSFRWRGRRWPIPGLPTLPGKPAGRPGESLPMVLPPTVLGFALLLS